MLKTEVPQDKGQSVFSDSTVVLKLRSTLYEVEDDVTIHIYLPDSRSLDVQIKVQFFEVLGQLVRYFGTMLPVFVLCNIMLTYYYQVGQINLGKPCHSLRDAHNLSSKPYKVQPFISLLKFCFGYEWFKLLWYSIGLPQPDSIILDKNYKLWFSFLPLILFLYAFEILSVTMMLQTFTIKMFSKVLTLFSYTESIFKHQVFHSLALAFLLQTHSAFSLLYIVLMCFTNLCSSYNLVVE
uniref:Uncharacterized protein n=1 Tax=Ciona savignyi TaxID=51511 RepID=H2Z5S3_CIOSA